MQLRHAITGAIYTSQNDPTGDRVHVKLPDGREGLFNRDGTWIRGELREADPHLTGIVCAPDLGNRRGAEALDAPAANARRGVPVPELGAASRSGERKKGMDLGLSGKRVLVTAASRGIGLSIAEALADEGCSLAICARGESGLESARKDLEKRGAKVFAQALDVSDGESLKAFVAAAIQDLGGLDCFISNASAGGGPGEKAWQANFDVDVMGAVRGVEAALPALQESDSASVIFVSSTAALEYLGVPQAYNAMKAALIAHASDLSQALAPKGVRVNVISPGPIYFEGGNWEMIKETMPQVYEGALAQCAIGRMGTPEEVARAVVFLTSPAASLITGANLVVDGGFTKRMAF